MATGRRVVVVRGAARAEELARVEAARRRTRTFRLARQRDERKKQDYSRNEECVRVDCEEHSTDKPGVMSESAPWPPRGRGLNKVVVRTLGEDEQERAVNEEVRVCDRLAGRTGRRSVMCAQRARTYNHDTLAVRKTWTHEGDVQDVHNAAAGWGEGVDKGVRLRRFTDIGRSEGASAYQLTAPGKSSVRFNVVTAAAAQPRRSGSDDSEGAEGGRRQIAHLC